MNARAYRAVMLLNILAVLGVLLYLKRVHRVLNYAFGDVDSYQQAEHRMIKVSGTLTVFFSPVLIPHALFDIQNMPYRNLVGVANLVWVIFAMTFLLTLWLRMFVNLAEDMHVADERGEER